MCVRAHVRVHTHIRELLLTFLFYVTSILTALQMVNYATEGEGDREERDFGTEG